MARVTGPVGRVPVLLCGSAGLRGSRRDRCWLPAGSRLLRAGARRQALHLPGKEGAEGHPVEDVPFSCRYRIDSVTKKRGSYGQERC